MNPFYNIEALVVAIASAIYNAGYKQQKTSQYDWV